MLKPKGSAFLVLCLLSWASLSTCDFADATLDTMQAGSKSRSMAAAEFRYVARDTYGAAQSRSCEGASVDYATALNNQIVALRTFEDQARSSVAGFHLALARAEIDETRCWEDRDPRFAERHVAMARERLAQGLEVLPQLASSLPNDALVDSLPAEVSAAFRARIVPLIRAINPLCPLSKEAGVEDITRTASARLADFERQIADTAFGMHFSIAEADVLYEQSITLVECGNPSSDDPEQMRTAMENEMKSQIASLEALYFTGEEVR